MYVPAFSLDYMLEFTSLDLINAYLDKYKSINISGNIYIGNNINEMFINIIQPHHF